MLTGVGFEMGKVMRCVGDVLKIPLFDNCCAYAAVSSEPLLIFYDKCEESDGLSVDEIVDLPIAFKVFVYNDAVTSGAWPRIGNVQLSEDDLSIPYMYKQDGISGRLSIYHSDFSDTNYERSATAFECLNLECAAVWEAKHVESRLVDHFLGRENEYLKQLKIDFLKVPADQK